jgi:hypothetical protein
MKKFEFHKFKTGIAKSKHEIKTHKMPIANSNAGNQKKTLWSANSLCGVAAVISE